MPLGASHWFYLIILLVIAQIIFGPGKLPEAGSAMGRAIREFKKAIDEPSPTEQPKPVTQDETKENS